MNGCSAFKEISFSSSTRHFHYHTLIQKVSSSRRDSYICEAYVICHHFYRRSTYSKAQAASAKGCRQINGCWRRKSFSKWVMCVKLRQLTWKYDEFYVIKWEKIFQPICECDNGFHSSLASMSLEWDSIFHEKSPSILGCEEKNTNFESLDEKEKFKFNLTHLSNRQIFLNSKLHAINQTKSY